MIFTQDLSPLFEVDLKGYGLGAVVDKPTTTDGFNAGLLVIDKTWWQRAPSDRGTLILLVSIINRSMEIRGILNLYFKMRGFHYLGPIIYK